MTLATLILLAHLDGYPVMQRRIRFDGVSTSACAMLGQAAAATWADENEGWVIESISCRRAGR